LSGLPQEISEKSPEIEALHGVFIAIKEDGKVVILSPAKDYLVREVFPAGCLSAANRTIFFRSLQALSTTLQRDIYCLNNPGFLISEVKVPEPDPLEGVQYSCVHWISHLCRAYESDTHHADHIGHDSESVACFIQKTLLYWLEAMSLLGRLNSAADSLKKLESLPVVSIYWTSTVM
jgi:hypothetical protein